MPIFTEFKHSTLEPDERVFHGTNEAGEHVAAIATTDGERTWLATKFSQGLPYAQKRFCSFLEARLFIDPSEGSFR